jgi:biotin carboxylase
MRVLLIMRNTYGWNGDHIEALRQLGIDIHLATGVPGSEQDPRFASVVPIPAELDLEQATTLLVDTARRLDVDTVMTFYEADMVLTALVNAELGAGWARPKADIIARDKRRQREFLTMHGLPSAHSVPVRSVTDGLAAADDIGYPVIVKPTFLSASIGVTLAADRAALDAALTDTERLADSWQSYFLARQGPAPDEYLALLEEFLPGKEVTVDGVVLFGRFYLAGVTDKMQMPGPHFEEDYYTLPNRTPEEESELIALCQAIADGLEVSHALFNAEFRRDAAGTYRVIEFATRLSGGQNYRNLRDVYGLDVVRLFTKAILTDDEARTWAGELTRTEPRMATCIKYIYRSGLLLRNNPGDAWHSPYFRSYYPAARPGARLRRAPEGWYEFAGSLSVGATYREPGDIERVKQIATDLDWRLDVLVVSG